MKWVATSVTVANQFTVHEVIQIVNNIVLSEVLWQKVNSVVKINKYVKKKISEFETSTKIQNRRTHCQQQVGQKRRRQPGTLSSIKDHCWHIPNKESQNWSLAFVRT